MSSHITVLPASTQAGKETIRVLLESETTSVRGIYRDPSKAPAEFTQNPRFEAAKGDVTTGVGLDFSRSDAVFYVPPPTYDGTDHGEFATTTANHVADALKTAGVKRLLLHSAVGAQHDHGIGVLRLNHITDKILENAAPEVIIVRPCYYFQFWAAAMETMRAEKPSFETPFSPADFKLPMVSIKDVGAWCANTLLSTSPQLPQSPIRLFGPRLYSPLDVKKAIESVTEKEGEMVVIAPEDLPAWWAKLVPEPYVDEFVELITAQLPGGLLAGTFAYGDDTVRCERELVDDLREMI